MFAASNPLLQTLLPGNYVSTLNPYAQEFKPSPPITKFDMTRIPRQIARDVVGSEPRGRIITVYQQQNGAESKLAFSYHQSPAAAVAEHFANDKRASSNKTTETNPIETAEKGTQVNRVPKERKIRRIPPKAVNAKGLSTEQLMALVLKPLAAEPKILYSSFNKNKISKRCLS